MNIGFTMAVFGFVGIYLITGDWYVAFHSGISKVHNDLRSITAT